MTLMTLTRRHLFNATLAAATVPALFRAPPAAAAGPARHDLKIGLASYSLRKLNLDQAIAACIETGTKYLTVKDMHLPQTDAPEKLKAAVAKIKAAGITIMGGGVINMKEKDEGKIRKNFEYAKICGFPTIVASPIPDALDIVEAMVKEFGIPVAIHNHGPEDKLYPTPKDVLKLVAKRDKRVGCCMDIGHTARAGGDPVKTVGELGARLFDLHIKDLKDIDLVTGKGTQVEVGRGTLDIVGLLRQLHKAKFQGHVALEYEINGDAPLPGIKESLAYLRGAAAAMNT